jgi:hypothetical protein
MKHFLFLLIVLAMQTAIHAQTLPKDSLYFVHLTDGSTLYSNKVSLISSSSRGNYLLLDKNKQVPLSQTKDFKGWDGTFAVGNIGGNYDAYRLQNEGRRISLFSQCYSTTETEFTSPTPGGVQMPTSITTQQKAWFFRKGADGDIQPLTLRNLSLAVSDDSASLHELNLVHSNIYLGIGLAAAGIALMAAGIASTVNHNHALSNAYDQASAQWFAEAQAHPWVNNPMPPLPKYSGLSPVAFVGMAVTLSAIIPFATGGKHAQKALNIYNGID